MPIPSRNDLLPLRFYHSFPRRAKTEGVDPLAVLRNIARSGFLLAPEIAIWGDDAPPIMQRRVSFTLLSEPELNDHSETFGAFAVEVEPGTLPLVSVAYVPEECRKIIADLGSVQRTISAMWELRKQAASQNPSAWCHELGCSADGVLRVVDSLSPDPHEQLLNIISFANLLCRTGRAGDENVFSYWGQREWRLSDSFVKPDWSASVPNEDELNALLDIDAQFFGREMNANGVCFGTVAKNCRFFRSATTPAKNVLNFARRLICPRVHLEAANQILQEAGISLCVAAVEDLPSRKANHECCC